MTCLRRHDCGRPGRSTHGEKADHALVIGHYWTRAWLGTVLALMVALRTARVARLLSLSRERVGDAGG